MRRSAVSVALASALLAGPAAAAAELPAMLQTGYKLDRKSVV